MPSPQLKDTSVLEIRGEAAMFWEKRMENDGSGNPIYIGYNRTANASQSALSWFIVKITYTATFPTYYQLPNAGTEFKYSWTDRATYFS